MVSNLSLGKASSVVSHPPPDYDLHDCAHLLSYVHTHLVIIEVCSL